ncbi:MAG: hypothetical protein KGY80_03405 [Candidatus Thorarchaeota archaeon]|nr:hypothetical protein [Candidatus Thorarchaeota archaeon]
MDCKIREWDRRADMAFSKKAELEAFKGTIPNADELTESEIRNKLKEMDENDPVDPIDPSHEVFNSCCITLKFTLSRHHIELLPIVYSPIHRVITCPNVAENQHIVATKSKSSSK